VVTGKVTVTQPNPDSLESQCDAATPVAVPVRYRGEGGAIILVATPHPWVFRRLLQRRCLLPEDVE
jgi:hypothetical protein